MAKNSRRGNGEGSIFQRKDGRWQSVITVGYNVDGSAKRKTFYGKTRKEAVVKMNKALTDLQNGNYIEPSKLTVGEWLTTWLENYKKPKLKPTTFESYEMIIRVHISPMLGKIPLSKLLALNLQEFYNSKLKSGRKDGEGMSTQSVRHMHTIIKQALDQAVKENLIVRNVADATSPPTVRQKEFSILTEEQLETFMTAAKRDRLAAAYILDIGTGLRRGELLGLCWDCVDLDNGVVTIKRQLIPLRKRLILEETTKSKSGKRAIPIPPNVVKELKAHKALQAKEKLALGEAYQDQGYVFAKEDGTPLSPVEFTKRFQRILEKAGLPRVRLHDLRHSHASLLLTMKIHPKVVQERLGHSTISITLDKYSHLVPGLQEKAALSIDYLFENKQKKSCHNGQDSQS